MGRVLLATLLCVLAFAFATEAKVAWYARAQATVRDLSPVKAMADDPPTLTAQRSHVDHPAPPEPIDLWLEGFAALLLAIAAARLTRYDAHCFVRVIARPHFSPLLFFRPPPAFC